jgi:hypothetical protein
MSRKIKGLFAPLTQELFDDPRWHRLNDYDKFIFILVLSTAYLTNNQAPDDANYYRKRYGLTQYSPRIRSALDELICVFPKLIRKGKTLSYSNITTYKNEVGPNGAGEEEEEEEVEGEASGRPAQILDIENRIPPEKGFVEKFFEDQKQEKLEADKFFDHFSSNGWKVAGKAKMKDWKAAARNWIRNQKKFCSHGEIQKSLLKELNQI